MLLPHAESGLTPKKGERERESTTTTTGHLLSRSFPLLLLFLAGLVDTLLLFLLFSFFSSSSLSPLHHSLSLFFFFFFSPPFRLIIHGKQPRERISSHGGQSLLAQPRPWDLSFPFILLYLLLGVVCSLCRCYF